MKEWCVFRHGNPERVLIRVQHDDGYTAWRAAIGRAKKRYSACNVTVDQHPPLGGEYALATGYHDAPVWRPR